MAERGGLMVDVGAGRTGGREKAPAAFCRKALTATTEFEMWGDGKQTRSFTFIDDCVEGILRCVLELGVELMRRASIVLALLALR